MSERIPTHSRNPSLARTYSATKIRSVGNYNLGNKIGKGQFGCTYKAMHNESGNFYAIKEVDLSSVPKDVLSNLKNEAEIMRGLEHTNILKIVDFIETKQSLFFVLEYIENGSLTDVIKKFGVFPESLVCNYTCQVLKGLSYLHSNKIIHRDIKGSNLLLTKEGNVVLADFGLAMRDQDNKKVPEALGTPFWLAPEVALLEGSYTASDIWSLGCTIIELLTGFPPYFELPGMSAIFRMVQDECPPLPFNISSDLDDFLRKCFQKDPALRPTADNLLCHSWIRKALRKLKKTRTVDQLEVKLKTYNKSRAITLRQVEPLADPEDRLKELSEGLNIDTMMDSLNNLGSEEAKPDITEETINKIDSKLKQINDRTEKEEKRYRMLSNLSSVVPRMTPSEESSDIKLRIESEKKHIIECLDVLTGYQKVLMQQLIKIKESAYIKYIVTGDYQADTHLSLKFGDIVYIFKELDENICYGEVISTGMRGKFPRSVLEEKKLTAQERNSLKKSHIVLDESQRLLGTLSKTEKYVKLTKFFGESQGNLKDTTKVLSEKQEKKERQLQEKIEKRTQKQEEKSEIDSLKAKVSLLESELKTALKDAHDFKTLLIKAQQENVELRKRLNL